MLKNYSKIIQVKKRNKMDRLELLWAILTCADDDDESLQDEEK